MNKSTSPDWFSTTLNPLKVPDGQVPIEEFKKPGQYYTSASKCAIPTATSGIASAGSIDSPARTKQKATKATSRMVVSVVVFSVKWVSRRRSMIVQASRGGREIRGQTWTDHDKSSA
jgi:hypothetical protein